MMLLFPFIAFALGVVFTLAAHAALSALWPAPCAPPPPRPRPRPATPPQPNVELSLTAEATAAARALAAACERRTALLNRIDPRA